MKISREESYIRMISNSKFNVVWIYGEKNIWIELFEIQS